MPGLAPQTLVSACPVIAADCLVAITRLCCRLQVYRAKNGTIATSIYSFTFTTSRYNEDYWQHFRQYTHSNTRKPSSVMLTIRSSPAALAALVVDPLECY